MLRSIRLDYASIGKHGFLKFCSPQTLHSLLPHLAVVRFQHLPVPFGQLGRQPAQ
jgi:hypothetical protein